MNEKIGTLKIQLSAENQIEFPIVSLESISKSNMWYNMIDYITLIYLKWHKAACRIFS